MNSPTMLALSTEAPAATDFRHAFRGAAKRVTWRVVGTTLAITVALDVWALMEVAFSSFSSNPLTVEAYFSATIINLLVAFSIMFTTLVADVRVAGGAKRLPAYACAVAIGSAVGALVQWEVHRWLELRSFPNEEAAVQPAFVFFEYLIWASIIVFIYVNRRSALMAAARMNKAHVQRAETQRRTLESRLQVLQARVEPQFLFSTLAQVRNLYESDPAKGGQVLGDLIVYLRAVLPHLRESTPTLGQEIDLVNAYFNIMRTKPVEHLAFHVDVPDTARAARMPPMVLLPLIDHVLIQERPAPGMISITARSTSGKLRVEVIDSGEGFAPGVKDNGLHVIQDRMHALYGNDGILTFERPDSNGTRAVMEIPHESADGDRR